MPVKTQIQDMMNKTFFSDEGLVTMKEFTQAFEIVVRQMLKFEKRMLDKNTAGYEELKQSFDILSKEIEATVQTVLKALTKDATTATAKTIEATKSLRAVYDKAAAITQPKDGKDGIDGLDGRDGIDGKDGKDGSPDTGKDIMVKINDDKSTKVIRKEKVEGLTALLKRLKEFDRSTSSTLRLRPGGDFVYMEDLSSQTDGITKTFTIPQYRRAIMVVGSDFPSVLFNSNGFTVVQGTLTLTTENAPSAGSQLGFQYIL